ncbi:hypothetical protein WJX74_005521 [Apatococcus lobatus]|uniref:Uncharacterized protein n=1 Tax=Apatococcus lobatus TaxID=904363 RepID=A0AAW1RVL2_9CHLO
MLIARRPSCRIELDVSQLETLNSVTKCQMPPTFRATPQVSSVRTPKELLATKKFTRLCQSATPLFNSWVLGSNMAEALQAVSDLLAKMIDGLADVISAATSSREQPEPPDSSRKSPVQIQMTNLSREKTPVYEGRTMLKSAVDDPAATELATWNPEGLPSTS